MLTKPIRSLDQASRREYTRRGVARHRANRAKSITDIQESINNHRKKLGLPPKDFAEPKRSNKGRPRVEYLPPEEEMANMSNEELAAWKKEERRKRKILRAREKKALDERKYQELCEELAGLVKLVKQLDDGVKEFVETVEGVGDMEDILHDEDDAVIEPTQPSPETAKPVIDASERKDVNCTPMMEVSKPEAAKSEFMMDVVEAEYVESQTKADIANPEDVGLHNLDVKPAPKNEIVITEPDDASGEDLIKLDMFTLHLKMPSLEEHLDLIPFDPMSNDECLDSDLADMLTDSSMKVDRVFSMDDELLVTDTMPDFLDDVDLLGDENNLLFGNALVSVFNDSI